MTTPEARDRSTSMSRAEGGEDGLWAIEPCPHCGGREMVWISNGRIGRIEILCGNWGAHPDKVAAIVSALRRQHTEEKTS